MSRETLHSYSKLISGSHSELVSESISIAHEIEDDERTKPAITAHCQICTFFTLPHSSSPTFCAKDKAKSLSIDETNR